MSRFDFTHSSSSFGSYGSRDSYGAYRPGACMDNNVPPDVRSVRSPGTFKLMGDPVSSDVAARKAFEKGPFVYQFRNGTSTDKALRYCRTEDDLALLCASLKQGRKVVMRHFRPDPSPIVPYAHTERPYSYW